LQACIPLSSLSRLDETEVNATNFDEVLEVTLTWLLEAQDALSGQSVIADHVLAIKEQFQEHEVFC